MPWDLSSDRPIFLQIVEIIQLDIISGKYSPGDKLPSVRDLAFEASVNPNTMQRALSELERSGLVYSQRTSGRFITEEVAMIEELKSALAQNKIREFLKSMQKLGFKNEETIALMQKSLDTSKPSES
ncbi:MAG: GntR family transcriptional regulator [Eubacterium sp.]|jgi:GntR family transcriptional regulator|nr:GntR family transcriptional regulator [Eubacterium sp.]